MNYNFITSYQCHFLCRSPHAVSSMTHSETINQGKVSFGISRRLCTFNRESPEAIVLFCRRVHTIQVIDRKTCHYDRCNLLYFLVELGVYADMFASDQEKDSFVSTLF